MNTRILTPLLILLSVVVIACVHHPKDPGLISNLVLGENKQAITSIQAAYYRHVRHPDAPYFYYLDFQMNEPGVQSVISDHGFLPISTSKISEIRWPKEILPPHQDQVRLYENPTRFLIKQNSSMRVIIISKAYAR